MAQVGSFRGGQPALPTLVETLFHIAAELPPSATSAPMQAIAISARITLYSMAVAPRRSVKSLLNLRIIAIPIPNAASRSLTLKSEGLRLSYPPSARPLLLVTAAALIDADGRVLVQQRLPERSMAGLWEFPGGKVEPEETPEAALIRELHEELGIDTEAACLAPAGFASEALGDSHLLLLLYICRKWRGIAQPLDASAIRWVRPIELHALPMPPADKPLIGLLDALL